jgi:hypothetical protein
MSRNENIMNTSNSSNENTTIAIEMTVVGIITIAVIIECQ